MKDIYFIVKDQLSAINGLYVDKDYGQLEELQPPVKFPCALLAISYPECSDLTGSDQRVRCQVNIKIGFMFAAPNTSSLFTDAMIEKSLSYFDTVSAIHNKMQFFSNDEVEPFSRKNAIEIQRKGLVILNTVYETYFDENLSDQ